MRRAVFRVAAAAVGITPLLLASPAQSPKVAEIVAKISSDNLKRHVDTLAAIPSRQVASATIRDAWAYIEQEFAANPRLQVRLDRFSEKLRRLGDAEIELVNVVATLKGVTDPDRYYVVSGHYDSIPSRGSDSRSRAPGAVDDASGTAAVLELARVLSQYEFDATIVFLAVTAEEQGLIGSRHWAKTAREQGLKIEAMITNDIVGNSLGGGGHSSNTEMRVFSQGVAADDDPDRARLRQSIGGEVDGPSRQLARYAKEKGEAYLPGFKVHLIYRRDRFGRGGDHTSFTRLGYTGVRFSEMYENYRRQHQNVRVQDGVEHGDLPEFFDAPYSARIVQVNAAVLATLADAPAAPTNVKIGGGGRYDTTLQWEPSEAADLAGYQILIRETSSPVWQRRVAAGNVTTHTLEGIIVDNYFFAVQAVDEVGNESLPVFPTGQIRRRRRRPNPESRILNSEEGIATSELSPDGYGGAHPGLWSERRYWAPRLPLGLRSGLRRGTWYPARPDRLSAKSEWRSFNVSDCQATGRLPGCPADRPALSPLCPQP